MVFAGFEFLLIRVKNVIKCLLGDVPSIVASKRTCIFGELFYDAVDLHGQELELLFHSFLFLLHYVESLKPVQLVADEKKIFHDFILEEGDIEKGARDLYFFLRRSVCH
jgi:hypothetical protein